MTSDQTAPTWQCLLICWGERYGADYINHTVEAVLRECPAPPRFVLISDRPRPGLHPAVQTVDFDPYYLAPEFLTVGCTAKLVMFEPGVIPDDLPTVYLDLDTAIFGDISNAISLMRTPKTVLMLQSVVLPFGWLGRLVYRLSNKTKYARGNSSIVVFHPAECGYISETWRKLYAEHGARGFKPMRADERFISWVAQEHIIRLPNWIAVKFLNEYMYPAKWLVRAKAALPWVRARRANLAAVTLPGDMLKPEVIVNYREGDELFENKGRRWLLWERRALGDMGERLQAYYKPLMAKLDANARTDEDA